MHYVLRRRIFRNLTAIGRRGRREGALLKYVDYKSGPTTHEGKASARKTERSCRNGRSKRTEERRERRGRKRAREEGKRRETIGSRCGATDAEADGHGSEG